MITVNNCPHICVCTEGGAGDRPAAGTPYRPAAGRNRYLSVVNYTINLRRLGWRDEDLRDGGSDALIDALVARGSGAQVSARRAEHIAAGADHVCIQLLTAPLMPTCWMLTGS